MEAQENNEEAMVSEALNTIPADELRQIILNNRKILKDLLKTWSERMERYELMPFVAKGMGEDISMGVQNGRLIALKLCIGDLRSVTNL